MLNFSRKAAFRIFGYRIYTNLPANEEIGQKTNHRRWKCRKARISTYLRAAPTFGRRATLSSILIDHQFATESHPPNTHRVR